jgi:hypothetical protein
MDVRDRIYEEPCGCRVDITGIVVHRCPACERIEQMPHVPPIAPHDLLLFQRTPEGPRVILRHNLGEEEIKFDPRCARHSPTGFEWGYGGSGPAELARHLTYGVARHLGISPDRWDQFDYQIVKWEFVARIPWQGGGYHASEIYEALGLSRYLDEPEW